MKISRKYLYLYSGFLALGLLGGYLYWNFWGCNEGCPIDASWKWSLARGGTIGLCVAAIIQPSAKKKSATHEEASE